MVKIDIKSKMGGIAEKARERLREKSKLKADLHNILDTVSTSVTAIGIDVGTSSVKAAVVRGAGKKAKVLNFLSKEIPRRQAGRASTEAISQAIFELASGLGKQKDALVAGIFSTQSAMIRNIEVPFKKEARISQVIKFETEVHIPLPIENVIVNHWSLPLESASGTSIMVAAVKKADLSSFIEIMKNAGVEPEVVELEAFSIFNCYLLTKESHEPSPTLILDIGAGKSTAILARERHLFMVRSIGVGGDAFTLSIADALGVPFAEAERLKLAFSAGKEEVAVREKAILSAIQGPLARLQREIDVTIGSAHTLLKGEGIERVLICGGGSRLPGVTQYLSSKLGCSVELLEEITLKGPGVPVDAVRYVSALGAAAGQVMRLGKKTNLRGEELAYTGRQARLKKQLATTAVLALSLVVAWVGLFFFNLHLKKKLQQELRSGMSRCFKAAFPSVTREAGNIIDQMEKEYEKLGVQYQSFEALSEGSISSLEIFREISSLMPKEVDLQVTDLTIEEDDVTIKGKTTEFANVDAIKNSLQKSRYFKSVKDFPAEKGRDGYIKFKFVMERRG